MKFASYTTGRENRLGVLANDGTLLDVAELMEAVEFKSPDSLFTDLIRLIEAGPEAQARVRRALEKANANPEITRHIPLDQINWLSPVLRPSKICCIALNNSANSARIISGPKHPAFFLKASNALVGHGEPIRVRCSDGRVHPEPELGVIISKTATEINATDAYDYVYGYTIHNDITGPTMRGEDTFQYRAIHPSDSGKDEISYVDTFATYPGRYKCSDTFSPLGPWLVTKDEISDPHALSVQFKKGDQTLMEDNTSNLTSKIPEALAFITKYITLLPGDVLSMGTALKKSSEKSVAIQNVDLQNIDEPISVSISGLGTLMNVVKRI